MSDTLMEKMLDLPEFEVTDFKQNDNDMGFYVETKERPTVCPVCGCYKPNLVIYKSRKQTVRDINALGKRCALIINRHYYECRECGGRFAEPLESAGVGERLYQSYEYGKVTPSITVVIALADYFDVSLDYLVGRSNDPIRR